MAFRGIWFTANAFLIGPMLQERSDITNQVEVVTNWIDYNCSAVAAATGRGFKSRRPDAHIARTACSLHSTRSARRGNVLSIVEKLLNTEWTVRVDGMAFVISCKWC
jgi:hypothetical protein